VLGRAWSRSDIIFTTGGLGPTEDDLTREGIAATLGEELYVDPQLEEWIRGIFASRGVAMPERNLKQAMLIPSARPIPNPRGTAPGWWVEKENKIIVSMPGVPSEMMYMWEHEVAPELERRPTGAVIVTRTIKTSGIGEGQLDEQISPLLKSTNPSIGVYARADGVHVRIGAKAASREEAYALIRPVEEGVRRILGPYIWGYDDDNLAVVTGRMLKSAGLTLATMESCTGGLLASTITDVPGASAYFRGGFVAYATEMKVALGVPRDVIDTYGVISTEAAQAMARAARERAGADIGIGITGVAGPDPQDDHPVGEVHLALARPDREPLTFDYTMGRDREAIKRRAVIQALALLKQSLGSIG
jgi:nicotinamide-nucleotide amidase